MALLPVIIALILAQLRLPSWQIRAGLPEMTLGHALAVIGVSMLFVLAASRIAANKVLEKVEFGVTEMLQVSRSARLGRAMLTAFVLALYGVQMGIVGWGFFVEDAGAGLGLATGSLIDTINEQYPAWAKQIAGIGLIRVVLLVINILGKYFLIFLPFVAMMLLSWSPMLKVDRLLRGSTWRIRSYLSFKLRNDIMILLIPAMIFWTMVEMIEYWSPVHLISSGVYLPILATGVAMFLVYLVAPFLLVNIWVTHSMPDGPLRRRLEDVCRRAGIGFRRIMVWDTMGGAVANACVTGFVGPLRYILITDTLLDNMNDDEIEAIFGHELGHAHFMHFPFFFEFILSMIFVSISLEWLFQWLVGIMSLPLSEQTLMGLASFLAWGVTLGVYLGGLFGMASRRFERQADIFGAFVVNNVSAFASALIKVARMNGSDPDTPSWRHFSISRRLDFLDRAREDPEILVRFDRELKVMLLIFTAIAMAAVAVAVVAEIV